MEEEQLRAVLESLLFAASEPVSIARLGNAIESVSRDAIRAALTAMAAAYINENRGIMLEEVAGGYQLRTRKEHGAYIRRLLSSKPPRLSRPLLETLAIIAYRPAITRPEIEELRGVDTGGVLETLAERGLIKIAGRKEGPGRPALYETTLAFLELFGLKTLADLPDLEEFQAITGIGPQLNATPPISDSTAPVPELAEPAWLAPASEENPTEALVVDSASNSTSAPAATVEPQPTSLADTGTQGDRRSPVEVAGQSGASEQRPSTEDNSDPSNEP